MKLYFYFLDTYGRSPNRDTDIRRPETELIRNSQTRWL